MAATKNTPTPWHISWHDGAKIIGTTDQGQYPVAYIDAPTITEGLANAKFVVLACNAHDELVRALEDAANELRLLCEKDDANPYDPTLRARISTVLAKVKADA